MRFAALYGELKFIGRSMPNIRASPTAISEYALKSKYISKLYAKRAIHASSEFRVAFCTKAKPWFAMGDRESAKRTFFAKPMLKITVPAKTLSSERKIFFAWGISSL